MSELDEKIIEDQISRLIKTVYVINGSGGVGKDTFISMVSKIVKCESYSSVEAVKTAAKILGWNGEKDEKSRKFLSDLKFLSTEYNDFSFQSIIARIRRFYSDEESPILFLHIRETKEIQRLRALFPDIQTILITNKNVKQITSNEADAGVYNLEYDYVINNDEGLLELNQKVEEFLRCRQKELSRMIEDFLWPKPVAE